jgi:hypothetical protein
VDTSIVGVEKKPYKPTLLTAAPLQPAEQTQFLKQLDTIRLALRATPALADLRGYDWQTYASVKTSSSAPKAPVVAVLGYIVHPYTIYKNRPTVSSAEGPGLKIHINDPEQMLANQLYNVDEDAHFTTEPKVTGELNGLPVYSNQFVYISKRHEAPFMAVSQQRYLTHKISKAGAELKEMNENFAGVPLDKSNPRAVSERQKFVKVFEARLQALQDELAGLSDSERAEDAYLNTGGKATRPSGLATGTNGDLIMTLNPNLFDPALPRTAIQNIVLGTPQYFPELYKAVQQQIDKHTLLNLIQ